MKKVGLWAKYEKDVRRLIWRYIQSGWFSAADVEDLYQESWLAFNRIKGRYDPDRNFWTLLRVTIRREFIDIQRRKRVEWEITPTISLDEIDGTDFADEIMGDLSHRSDRLIDLIDFSKILSDDGRQILFYLLKSSEKIYARSYSLAPKSLRISLINLLRKEKKWKDHKIFKGLRSIRAALIEL